MFQFYVRISREKVHLFIPTSAAQFESYVDTESSVANVSVSGTADGAGQHSDVDMVYAVLLNASEEPEVLTVGTQFFASRLGKSCAEASDLVAPSAEVDGSKDEAGTIQNLRGDIYTAVEIVGQLDQITEVAYQIRALN